MKAVVVHQYGGPEVLKYEDYPDPVPGPGDVLVRVAATSVNPIDYKRRAGLTKDFYPLQFPGLIGVDMAGTVVKIGPGVEGFSVGDQVFAMADNTYAELCVVKAAILAKVPKGLDLIQAAALPLVTVTGNQLLSATGIKAGQTVLVVGAIGNVGRSAVFTAKQRGATVIAGVLKSQIDEAKTVGADQVVATDDDTAIANLAPLDAIADTVGGRTAEKLIAKVKPGGVYASVVEAPQNAAKYPSVKVVHVFSKFDNRCIHSSRLDPGDQFLGGSSADGIRNRIEWRKIRNRGVVVGCDHLIRPHCLRLIHLPLQNPCDHGRPAFLGSKYRRTPDISSSTYDEHRLARFDSSSGHELVAGRSHQRQRRGLNQIEPLGDFRQDRRLHNTKFGVSIVRHGEHPVTDGKAFHPRPNLDHRPRHIDSYEAWEMKGIKILR